MRIFLAFYLSILFSLNLCAQFSSEEMRLIDSLNNEIKTTKFDTTLSASYVYLSEILYVNNVDTLFPLCDNAREICEKNLKNKELSESDIKSFRHTLAASLNNLGYYFGQKGDPEKELSHYFKSLEIKKEINDLKGVAIAYNNIGMIYKERGDLKNAIDFYDKSLKIKEQLGDKKSLSLSLSNIGVIYESLGEIDKALEYYYKALDIQNELNEERLKAISLNNIALVYFLKNQYNKALQFNKRSLIIREKTKDVRGIANSYHNIGLVHKELGNFDTALEYYNKSLVLKEELNDFEGIPPTLSNIGTIYMETGKIIEAEKMVEKSLELSKKQKVIANIQNASRLLQMIYFKQGKYKQAYEMSELFHEMRDSVVNEQNKKAALKQNLRYEFDKKAAADSIAFEKENEIKEAEIAKQKADLKVKRNQQYALFGGLALVIVFAGFMFNRFKVTQKQKLVIEEQKHIVEEKNQEILDSIHYAKRIQAAILPSTKTVQQYLPNSFILYKPKDIVAGDFYWLEHKDKTVLFAACDCTGHGVPGAMVSVVCNNGLNRSVREHGLINPAQILDKTREIVISEFEKSEDEVKDGMDIALCSLENKDDKWILNYAGANNPLWIIRNDSLEIEEIKADKQPIGKYAEPTPYTSHTVELQKDDTIYIFSDGYVDQFGGEKGKKLKPKAFRELLLSIQHESMDNQRDKINLLFEQWKGNHEQVDDICVIGVRI